MNPKKFKRAARQNISYFPKSSLFFKQKPSKQRKGIDRRIDIEYLGFFTDTTILHNRSKKRLTTSILKNRKENMF
jgi:hypothetical protein